MEIVKEVLQIAHILKEGGHKAYLVGGCVRDLLLEKAPKDWDVATDAKPEQIQELFPDSVYENEFGTVGVKTDSENPSLKVVEVTTFRKEEGYSNKRHPDRVEFTSEIEEDLARRDFTINALALDLLEEKSLIDPFGGQKDLENKIIRSVRDPEQRVLEDALRLMRAVRFYAQLGFEIEEGTELAIKEHSASLQHISKERIRTELEKLLMGDWGHKGVEKMHELGLLTHVIPELEEGVDCEQNMHHVYSVFEHNLKSLEYAVSEKFPLHIRLAALLHDVGKPRTRQWKASPKGQKIREGEPGDWTFYAHQVLGAKMTKEILSRLTFPKDLIKKVALLVYEHMFVYDPEMVSLAGVRRLLARVGEENIDDLIDLRKADRIGSGVPKAQPYRLRHLLAMIEKVRTDPISVKMLKVSGQDLQKELGLEPGPLFGMLLDILLAEVLEDPDKNAKEILLARAGELSQMDLKKLSAMRADSRQSAQTAQEAIDEEIKKKYFVS